ncbi:hypothetical protein ACFPYI_12025 [Halomarina salina]|uniref:Uncharacterized protein n=1 Tax=Halomarina salina TaxID=1872699 RepID=A0ABD5RP07_9EURY|nr:hypothetical protein [Halomarina salina]
MVRSRSRRRALFACGTALTALAGCVTDSRSTPETAEPSPTPETATPQYDVPVQNLLITPSLVVAGDDSIGVEGAPSEQFVVVDVSDRGLASSEDQSSPSDSTYRLVTGSATYDPVVNGQPGRIDGYSGAFWPQVYEGLRNQPVVFAVPKPLDASSVSFHWQGGDYAFGDQLVQCLTRPPTAFTVREFSAPDTVADGREITAMLVVENTGDHDGTFVGALNRIGPEVAYTPVTGIWLDITAGEQKTWTYSYTPTPSPNVEDPRMQYVLEVRDGREDLNIDISRDS